MTYFDFMSNKTCQSQPMLSGMSGNWLAEHDKRFHPDGFHEGDNCSLREHEVEERTSDTLLPAVSKPPMKPFEPDKNKSVVQNYEDFAAYWHSRAGNYRKGPGHEPYIVHPRKVASVLHKWGFDDKRNPITMSVAYGHDLIEDAKAPKDDIIRVGGDKGKAIYGGIRMLSFEQNPLWMTKQEVADGKKDHIENIAKTAPIGILAVKMADRLCNTMDFVKAKDPWAHEYLRLGECLFNRLNEFPNKDVIKKTLDAVRERVSRLPAWSGKKPKPIQQTRDADGKTIYPKIVKKKAL